MNARTPKMRSEQVGAGLVEIMIGLLIGMLVMIVVYQIFAVSEGQKRTVTSGSDAQANAAYGLFLLGRDLSIAGNGISSAASALDGCALPKDNPLAPGMPALPLLRPIPVVINAGATATDPDALTIFYGASGSLSTPVLIQNNVTITASSGTPYQISSPVGFSPNDYVVINQGSNCTFSKVNAGGVTFFNGPPPNTPYVYTSVAHTPLAGNMSTTYLYAASASLVNLGQAGSLGRVGYFVDSATGSLVTQQMLPPVAVPAAVPVVAGVVNLKAQYGLDTDNDGTVDTWQEATGAWSSANLPSQPLATIAQIRVVRVAMVTQSAQYEKDPVTSGPLLMFDGSVSMNLTADQQHYRFKVLETVVPLRNAVWNAL
jgi:type IV pilus assembly protein PilW